MSKKTSLPQKIPLTKKSPTSSLSRRSRPRLRPTFRPDHFRSEVSSSHRHPSIRRPQPSPLTIKIQQMTFSFILFLLLIFGLYYLIERFFVIREVTCVLNQNTTPCPQSLSQAVAELRGQPMIFFNVAHALQQLQGPSLNFNDFTYTKVFPNQLHVSFNFYSALYQITPDGHNVYAFDQFGHYTISPSSQHPLLINSHHEQTSVNLTSYLIDQVLHQKFAELENYTRSARAAWTSFDFYTLNDLRITTTKATYILDLFNLDENLQKLDFLEANWLTEENNQLVDLRLRLPVVKASGS